jgi:hypothetical protein
VDESVSSLAPESESWVRIPASANNFLFSVVENQKLVEKSERCLKKEKNNISVIFKGFLEERKRNSNLNVQNMEG